MSDIEKYKIVMFDKYCPTCKHEAVEENEDPCEACISEYVKLNSEKPVKWEEKDN